MNNVMRNNNYGFNEAKLKEFRRAIEDAERVAPQLVPEGPTLEEVRNEMKDGLGRYRICADLLANPMGERSRRREQELRVGDTFPRNDTELNAYVTGLDKVIRKHAAGLAANGFRKDEQGALLASMAEYQRLLAERGRERGKVRAERVKREAVFERLRAITSYVRKVGRAALIDDVARAEFDRVKGTAKKRAIAPEPAPMPQPGQSKKA